MSARAAEHGNDAGSGDLFSRLYTKEECIAAALAEKNHKEVPDNKPPAHWPPDTVPDPSTWVFWLPDGWGQGLKTTCSGKQLKCYISPAPEGKRFFHKPDIEKFIGRALPKKEPPAPKVAETKKEVRNIHEAVPKWPDGEDWELPADWRLGFRRLPTTLHKIYVPPGESEGFLWHKHEVEAWLAGNKKKLTPFGGSATQAQRSAEALEKSGGVPKPKRKRGENDGKTGHHHHHHENEGEFFPLSKRLQQAKDDPWYYPESTKKADATFSQMRSLLTLRGFKDSQLELLYVSGGSASDVDFIEMLHGIYYRLPHTTDSKVAYQKLHCRADVLSCDRVYLCRFSETGQWQFSTMLQPSSPIYAYCKPAKAAGLVDIGPWLVPTTESEQEPSFKELPGLTIISSMKQR